MKIGIDARLLTQTGVGVYTYNLLNFLPKYLPKDWEVVVFVRSEDQNEIPHPERYHIIESNQRWHTFSEQIGFLQQLLKQNLDLMHFTYFSYPVFYKRPFISTIHDLTPVLFKTGKASTKSVVEYYPKFFAMNRVISSSVRNSVGIITPTQFVKNQLTSLYDVDQKKMYPIAEGINEKLKEAKENLNLKRDFTNPFFVYVGNFYPHKNVERLVNAFSKINDENELILVGPKDFFSGKIAEQIGRLNQKHRIIMFHHASLADLVFFYKNAKALIHPSLSEGFGLTLLEASYFSCPVVASNIDVFKETLGSDYFSFDPMSEAGIKEAIVKFIKSKPVNKSNKAPSKFSFNQMAKETVDVYKKVTQSSRT